MTLHWHPHAVEGVLSPSCKASVQIGSRRYQIQIERIPTGVGATGWLARGRWEPLRGDRSFAPLTVQGLRLMENLDRITAASCVLCAEPTVDECRAQCARIAGIMQHAIVSHPDLREASR